MSAAPLRIQRMQLKLQKYSLKVVWKKGTELVIVDSLSRAPVVSCDDNSDVDEYEVHSVGYLPISDIRMNELKQVTSGDMTLQMIVKYICQGWPADKSLVPNEVKPFWGIRDELYTAEGLVLKGDRVVVPQAMRADMLKQVHRSHLGVEKCKQRAKDVLFWPGMSAEIVEMCERCSTCAETRCKKHERAYGTIATARKAVAEGSN